MRKPRNLVLQYPFCYFKGSNEKMPLGLIDIRSASFTKEHARESMKGLILSLEKSVRKNKLTYVCQNNKSIFYSFNWRSFISYVEIIVVDNDRYQDFKRL